MIPFHVLLKFIDIAKEWKVGESAVPEDWTARCTPDEIELVDPSGVTQCKLHRKEREYAENQSQ